MHTHRITVGFLTGLVMVCYLVLGGLASPAIAKTSVVTTLADTADPLVSVHTHDEQVPAGRADFALDPDMPRGVRNAEGDSLNVGDLHGNPFCGSKER